MREVEEHNYEIVYCDRCGERCTQSMSFRRVTFGDAPAVKKDFCDGCVVTLFNVLLKTLLGDGEAVYRELCERTGKTSFRRKPAPTEGEDI